MFVSPVDTCNITQNYVSLCITQKNVEKFIYTVHYYKIYGMYSIEKY